MRVDFQVPGKDLPLYFSFEMAAPPPIGAQVLRRHADAGVVAAEVVKS